MLAVAGSEFGVDRVQTVQEQGSSKLHAGPCSPSVISSGRRREHFGVCVCSSVTLQPAHKHSEGEPSCDCLRRQANQI